MVGQTYNSVHPIDCIEIHNNPYLGYQFNVIIEESGIIRYSNNIDCSEGSNFFIGAENAEYIMNSVIKCFCYDTDECGTAMIDGYHWEILFYRKNELIDRVEGWPNECNQRYSRFRDIVEFIERQISKNLGAEYMTFIRSV